MIDFDYSEFGQGFQGVDVGYLVVWSKELFEMKKGLQRSQVIDSIMADIESDQSIKDADRMKVN